MNEGYQKVQQGRRGRTSAQEQGRRSPGWEPPVAVTLAEQGEEGSHAWRRTHIWKTSDARSAQFHYTWIAENGEEEGRVWVNPGETG